MRSPTRSWRAALLSALLLPVLAGPGASQTASQTAAQTAAAGRAGRVSSEENLRKDPQGTILARMQEGAPLTIVSREGPWAQVEIFGWIWARSVEASNRDGFDLVVSHEDGENLRDAPRGEMIGYLMEGALLQEIERQPGWIRVKRRAWMWGASVAEAAPSTQAPAPGPAGAPAAGGARGTTAFATAGASGAAILSAPGGDTVGTTRPRAELEVVARQGSWARVRLEGWTWIPPGDSAVAGGDPGDLTPAELRADPQGTAGRLVAWQLQFISLERAERVRTDFFEGEPFILARYGGAEGPFVYVAVPTDRLPEVQGLVPLEILSVTARVRTGASSLTGTPIVDLVSLEHKR
jgi:hypothetical protein